eukprot:scaffold23478_cov47-Attheya_sp.AAC.3
MTHVAMVPNAAKRMTATKSCGRIKYKMTENASKSSDAFKRIRKKEREKSCVIDTIGGVELECPFGHPFSPMNGEALSLIGVHHIDGRQT